MELVGGDGKKFDAIELYSCFPCVPKMARRTLGLGADVQPTVTGGLTFFGAPLNTYMTHAACAMVRKMRNGAKLGLLYGQGGFVTKHHGLVVSREAPREAMKQETSVQAEADRNKRAVPEFVTEASGKGKVEAFTVIYREQRRGRARRRHAAHRRRPAHARPHSRQRRRRRSRICATWTARRSARSATSPWRKTACRSGGWDSLRDRHVGKGAPAPFPPSCHGIFGRSSSRFACRNPTSPRTRGEVKERATPSRPASRRPSPAWPCGAGDADLVAVGDAVGRGDDDAIVRRKAGGELDGAAEVARDRHLS